MKRLILLSLMGILAGLADNADANSVVHFSSCTVGFTVSPKYPYVSSSNPLTDTNFNESEILTGYGTSGPIFYVDYNDEHAMLLGVREVDKKVSSSSTIFFENGTVSTLTEDPTTNAGSASPVLTGVADQYANDSSQRPLRPSVFITDVTGLSTTDPANQKNDWQFGGTAISPTAVYGTWIGAKATIDTTVTPNTSSDTLDSDKLLPSNNLGSGGSSSGLPDPFVNTAGKSMEAYSAEVQFDVTKLLDSSGKPLVGGHTYRLQAILHDGDRTSDSGEACVQATFGNPTISLAKSASPMTYTAAGQTITYTYTITNNGFFTETGPFSISDDHIGAFTCGTVPAGGLLPGSSMSCSQGYTISQADMNAGSVTNNATASSVADNVSAGPVSVTVSSSTLPPPPPPPSSPPSPPPTLCATCVYITGDNSAGNDAVYDWDPFANTLGTLLTQNTGGHVDSLVFDKNGDIIFDAVVNPGQLYLYSFATNTTTPLVTVGNSTNDLALEPSGNSILVASKGDHKIYRIDLTTKATSPLYTDTSVSPLGPDGIIYDNTGRLFACLDENSVAQINPVTGAVIKSIQGINQADGLTFNSTTGMLYAGSDAGGFYTISPDLSTATFTNLGMTIDGVGTTGHYLYLAQRDTAGIQYDLTTHSISAQITVPGADDIAPLSGLGSPTGPILTGLTPDATAAGSPALTIALAGARFVSGAVVTWNGSNLATTFIDSSDLSAVIPASDLLSVGKASVMVVNPDGQQSSILPFTITTAPSVLTMVRVSPQAVSINTGAQVQFTAIAYDQFGSTMTLATPFHWSNDENPVNTIDSNGLYQAGTLPGPDVVRATNQGVQGAATVIINRQIPINPPPPNQPPLLTSIRVSPSTATIFINAQAKFLATAYDQYGNPMTLNTPFVWSNDNNPPNSIDMTGLYQAGNSPGSDIVRATDQGVQGTATVTISSITAPLPPSLPPPPPPLPPTTGQPPGGQPPLGQGGAIDISNARAYPVPWKSTGSKPYVTFTGLAPGTEIRIFTTDGRLVRTLNSVIGGDVHWFIDNNNGERVASWVYVYIITNPTTSQTVKGKLVVIQ